MQENFVYRVERSADGHFVGCYYGREGIDVYSTPLRRVAWWELLPWQECPPFETGTNDIGCYALACSILAHHFSEPPEFVAKKSKGDSKTYARFFSFAVQVIRTQRLEPGQFYVITSEVINEWLGIKETATQAEPAAPAKVGFLQ